MTHSYQLKNESTEHDAVLAWKNETFHFSVFFKRVNDFLVFLFTWLMSFFLILYMLVMRKFLKFIFLGFLS